jgi:hypothetical protein
MNSQSGNRPISLLLSGSGGIGSALLFSSAAAEIGLSNNEAIAAAKGSSVGLMRTAAATCASRGLRFDALAARRPQPESGRVTGQVFGSDGGLSSLEQRGVR